MKLAIIVNKVLTKMIQNRTRIISKRKHKVNKGLKSELAIAIQIIPPTTMTKMMMMKIRSEEK